MGGRSSDAADLTGGEGGGGVVKEEEEKRGGDSGAGRMTVGGRRRRNERPRMKRAEQLAFLFFFFPCYLRAPPSLALLLIALFSLLLWGVWIRLSANRSCYVCILSFVCGFSLLHLSVRLSSPLASPACLIFFERVEPTSWFIAWK